MVKFRTDSLTLRTAERIVTCSYTPFLSENTLYFCTGKLKPTKIFLIPSSVFYLIGVKEAKNAVVSLPWVSNDVTSIIAFTYDAPLL
jgi:hypothetical protein